jgi:hypothetical protein
MTGCFLRRLMVAACWLSAVPTLAQPHAPMPGFALAEAQQQALQSLQRSARERQLHRDATWRTLLHYRVHPLTRSDRSLADDPGFFASPNGAHDSAAELDATLAAFFDPRPRFALEQRAACRFIARYQWLSAQLGIDPQVLPPPACPRYEEWRRGLSAGAVTLVFPAAYVNSPASMYGHTFLRLDPAPAQAGFNPLLSYAINYAAAGNEAEGLAFAFKGLTGLYAGQFTNAPYYLRIREYSDLENRDIWEYELDLSPQEIDRLLAHAWELGPTRFDYFFFDENCSYHLLSLLDAARPGLDLTRRFTWWAIPVDTVRAVTETPGLLRRMVYRPSNSTELRHRATQLGPRKALAAREVAQGRMPLNALAEVEPDAPSRALMLETAERLVAYEGSFRRSTDQAIAQRRTAILAARAALPEGAPVAVPTPATPPNEGHRTARVDVMVGARNGTPLWQVMARPAYHDLMDPEAGFQRGAAIQFGRIEFSQRRGERVRLDRFTPVEIQSLTPGDGLIEARSWRVRAGLGRGFGPDARDPYANAPLAFEANGGPGWAMDMGAQRGLAYAFIDNQASWDRGLPRRPWAFGSGLAAGLLWDATSRWRIGLEAHARAYLMNQPGEGGLRIEQRWQLDKSANASLRCQLAQREGQGRKRECVAGLQRYW